MATNNNDGSGLKRRDGGKDVKKTTGKSKETLNEGYYPKGAPLPVPTDPWSPLYGTALKALLIVRCFAAIFVPFINDCDEVFNYWEPMHYLQYGYGLQTWEYAPQYAIRSWFYICMYAIPSWFLRAAAWPLIKITGISEKLVIFYGLRLLLAITSSIIETMYYRAVVDHISSRIGRYLLWMLLASPGMFLSTSTFLPSTFAMYTTVLAFTALVKSYSKIETTVLDSLQVSSVGVPIFWVAAGAIVGWPFSGAIGVPLVFQEVFVKTFYMANDKTKFTLLFLQKALLVVVSSLVSTLILAGPLIAIDYIFYRKLTVVPWNIVSYNVFNKGGGGPDLYGTEPWYYYAINGFLNFNIAFPLALISIPAIYLSYKCAYQHIVASTNVAFLASSNGRPYQTLLFKLLPVYFWLSIFSLQPHKEERFLFVVYPLICFNASVSIAFIRGWLMKNSWSGGASFFFRKPLLFTYSTFTIFTVLSLARIAAVHTNYRASIGIYHSLGKIAGSRRTLCLGSEWHRFPSHYMLPSETRVRWIDSGFTGHLPKYFLENKTQNFFESRLGTYEKITGFNHLNQGDSSVFVQESECTDFVGFKEETLKGRWKEKECMQVIDRKTASLYRAFYIPYKRDVNMKWTFYCHKIRSKW